MNTLPSEVEAALRERVDHLLHVQFERGKHETAEFARLHWDNKQSWPTLNDALMQAIEETLQPEIERLVLEAQEQVLDLVAKDQAWENSRDHIAVKLGLPIRYDHSNGKCVCKGEIYREQEALIHPKQQEEKHDVN